MKQKKTEEGIAGKGDEGEVMDAVDGDNVWQVQLAHAPQVTPAHTPPQKPTRTDMRGVFKQILDEKNEAFWKVYHQICLLFWKTHSKSDI